MKDSPIDEQIAKLKAARDGDETVTDRHTDFSTAREIAFPKAPSCGDRWAGAITEAFTETAHLLAMQWT